LPVTGPAPEPHGLAGHQPPYGKIHEGQLSGSPARPA
jgi:hypothetical protein